MRDDLAMLMQPGTQHRVFRAFCYLFHLAEQGNVTAVDITSAVIGRLRFISGHGAVA
ncbi:MAG: hypothetical protein ACRDSR_21060 [Pseudonocardiaceae bacterium]